MSFQTEANIKLEELQDEMKILSKQVDKCSSLLADVVSINTDGSRDWKDSFRTKVFNTQKDFIDFTQTISDFLTR